jgi:hypothetical protein
VLSTSIFNQVNILFLHFTWPCSGSDFISLLGGPLSIILGSCPGILTLCFREKQAWIQFAVTWFTSYVTHTMVTMCGRICFINFSVVIITQ